MPRICYKLPAIGVTGRWLLSENLKLNREYLPSQQTGSNPHGDRKSDASVASGQRTLLARGAHFAGKVSFEQDAQIDGVVEGELHSTAELTVGETGEVRAGIQGCSVRVFGRVTGDIECSERLELLAGAQVSGNITSPRLIIHDGVVFDGECRMREKDAGPARKF